ncbi:uncharacterized protein LOC122874527 [Siniperca chuatsi]|uniref:uncharacterized protein LOC122874527 n=1 Tax=Siniperca chuatsi TaxID=119488 RepID=UPI001CE09949|nr:uncharacterized protein LOC122874527 [Siniperca chuatsi]
MASDVVVRPKKTNFDLTLCECLLLVSVMMISALVNLFVDEKAEEERRKQRVLSMKQVLGAVAGSLASGLNVLLQYVTHFLQAAGIQVGLPINTVTPEGVIFVAQWVLLLLICYVVITLAFQLVTFFLRWIRWLLKLGVVLACFGLILKDHSVGTETMAIRLVCLGCICILLSIRPWKDRTMAARIVHLEEQVKILENRLREMERWRRRCVILSCCLIGLLCFVVFIVFIVIMLIVISSSQ